MVDKVDSRLYGKHHTLLKDSCRSQITYTWLINALNTLLKMSYYFYQLYYSFITLAMQVQTSFHGYYCSIEQLLYVQLIEIMP